MLNLDSLLPGVLGGVDPMVTGTISVVFGLLTLLFGYRLFRIYLFIVGFAVGTVVASMFTELPLALLCGLISGFVCIGLWYIGLFLLGAACGALLACALGVTFTPVILAIAIFFGILAIIIRKFMIIVSTSWSGADMIIGAIGPAIGIKDSMGMLLATLVLAIIGIVCQYTITSGKAVVPVGAAGGGNAAGGNAASVA